MKTTQLIIGVIMVYLGLCMLVDKLFAEESYPKFINALIHVESSGRDKVIGDNGLAVGCLQIHPIMISDVNRICKLKGSSLRFTLSDRTNRVKSIQIATIFFQYYVKDMKDYESMARSWNGGPSYKIKSTDGYWKKVKKLL
jgi:hypothetical protein